MVPKEGTKHSIEGLLQKFKEKEAEGKVEEYNEDQVKQYFIMPLFRMLGWDIENEEEVVPEEKASKGWVDYAFKINGIPKFYVEVKKPSVDLNHTKWAKQAVDYAYHKGVTWVILTNFREFKIFNSEIKKTNPIDNEVLRPTATWQEYATTAFDEKIWYFSKESILKGELDAVADKWGIKIKRIPIDKALLNYLVDWREKLSKDILKNNQDLKLKEEEIDEAVQRLIDRFIFIRKCEDLQLEEMKLWPTISMSSSQTRRVIHDIQEIFKHYEKFYDSDLFKESLADKVIVSGDLLEEIIKGLHRTPDNINYDFAFIEADILGSIYEQYLGHILKKTKKGAKLGESKAHRKEQGIYYTPTYIVDYIVKNTLGELIKDKSTAEIKKIKVLDPACGSGSFLIKAFDTTYTALRKKEKVKDDLIPAWQSEILTDNIYGVDLDQRAVEIARLNLMLKTVEKGKRLPLLEKNIKCGNSLIDDEKVAGNKAFEWKKEFQEIMNEGGFDVVIGNPPYVRVDNLDEKEKQYFKSNFKSSEGKYDLYYLFMEHSLKLLKRGGKFGFIVPNKFCAASSAAKLREIIRENATHCSIISVSHLDVFKEAANYPVLLILTKGDKFHEINMCSAIKEEELLNKKFKIYVLKNQDLEILPAGIFPINIEQKHFDLVIKLLKKSKKLGHLLKISEGLRIPQNLETMDRGDFEILKQYQFDRWGLIKKGTNISKGNLIKVISASSERYQNSLKDKIVIAEDALSITATFDNKKRIPQGGVYFGVLLKEDISLKCILSVLNSKLLSFVYKILFGGMHMGGGYLRYRTEFLEQLPLQSIKEAQQKMLEKYADKMFDLNKKIKEIGDKQTSERARLEEEIKRTDDEIDDLVYKLYGITEEEKKIIEGSLK